MGHIGDLRPRRQEKNPVKDNRHRTALTALAMLLLSFMLMLPSLVFADEAVPGEDGGGLAVEAAEEAAVTPENEVDTDSSGDIIPPPASEELEAVDLEPSSIEDQAQAIADEAIVALADEPELHVQINGVSAGQTVNSVNGLTITITGPVEWLSSHTAGDSTVLVSIRLPSRNLCTITVGNVATTNNNQRRPAGDAVPNNNSWSFMNSGGTFTYIAYLNDLTALGTYTVSGEAVDDFSFTVDYSTEGGSRNLPYLQSLPEASLSGTLPPLPNNTHYGFNKVIIHTLDGSLQEYEMNGNTSVSVGADGYTTIDGSPTINLDEYIRLANTNSNPTLIMLRPTEGAIIDTFTDTLLDFEIILGFYTSPPDSELCSVSLTISKVHLSLRATGEPFEYGANIPALVNTNSFINNHVIARSNGAVIEWSIQPSDVLISPSTTNPVLVRVQAGSEDLLLYPTPSEGFTLGWGDPSIVRTDYRDGIVIDNASRMSCSFNPCDMTPLTELIKNQAADGSLSASVCTGVIPSQVIWLLTEHPVLDGASGWTVYDGMVWDGATEWGVALASGVPTDYTLLSGKVAMRDSEKVYIGPVKADLTPPSQSAQSIECPSDVHNETYPAARLSIYEGPVHITFTVTDDSSGSDSSGITSISLVYHGEDDDYTISLTQNADGTYSAELPGAGLSDNYRFDMARFTLTLSDIAGNSRLLQLDSQSNPASDIDTLIVDTLAPEIDISFGGSVPEAGHYFGSAQTAYVTVQSFHMADLIVVDPNRPIAKDTSGRTLLTISDLTQAEDGSWQCVWPCPADGEYSIQIGFTDLLGRTATGASLSFVIDLQAPLILVTFDNENSFSVGYYNAPRTATIQVMDRNTAPELIAVSTSATDAAGNVSSGPGPSGWSMADDTWTATVYFAGEYTYSLSVSASDRAGHSSTEGGWDYSSEPFTIDLTAPELIIEGVRDSWAYADEIAPKVTFSDLNLETFYSIAEITRVNDGHPYYSYDTEVVSDSKRIVSYADFPDEPTFDNVYVLEAQATDKAGNKTTATITFSVNRFGSTYMFSPATRSLNGTYTNTPQEIIVYEINVSGLDESKISLNLSVEGSAKLLTRGEGYSLASEVDSTTKWHVYTYVLPKSTFDTDGLYSLTVRSTDAAGSLSENIMPNKDETRTAPASLSFIYDKTAPQGTLEGAITGGVYIQDSLTLTAYVRDNIAWQSASLIVNGKTVAGYENTENSNFIRFDYNLTAAESAYSVQLIVKDKAGNESSVTLNNVKVSASVFLVITQLPFHQWWAASGLMRALIIGAICLLAVTLFLIAFYYNRKRQRAIEEAGIVFTDGDSSGGSGGMQNSSGTSNTPTRGSSRSGSGRGGGVPNSSGTSNTPTRGSGRSSSGRSGSSRSSNTPNRRN